MKKFYGLLIPFLFVIISYAQSPNWVWAKSISIGSLIQGGGNYVSKDPEGNIYASASYFDTVTIGSTTFYDQGYGSIYTVKYDPSGNVIWAKSTRGGCYVYANGVSADSSGNVFVTGTYSCDSLYFDDSVLVTGAFQSAFLVKYDAAGNVVWVRGGGGPNGSTGIAPASSTAGNGVCTDASGNAYIAGGFLETSMVFGADSLSDADAGMNSIYIVKYDGAGNVIWANIAGGPGPADLQDANEANGITVDAAGNVYVAGYFQSSPMVFGNDTLLPNGTGATGIFLARYNASGNLMWVNSAGGTVDDAAANVSTDAFGHVYITGTFSSPLIAFGNTSLTNTGMGNIFTVKYDTSGAVIWAKSSTNSAQILAQATGLATDAAGNVYIAGEYGDVSVQHGSISFDGILLRSVGYLNICIVKYDSSGNLAWVKSAGSGNNDYGSCITVDGLGNPYAVGIISSSAVTFGNTTITDDSAAQDFTMYLAKLDNTTTGIANPANASSIVSVFPNPSNSNFYFEGVQAGYTLEVYDVLGQLIHSSTIGNDNYALNLGGNARGIYFYRIAEKSTLVQQGKIVLN